MGIHTAFNRLPNIAFKYIRGQGNNRNTGNFRIIQPAYFLRSLPPIHNWHLDIHKNKVKFSGGCLAQLIDCNFSINSRVYIKAQIL